MTITCYIMCWFVVSVQIQVGERLHRVMEVGFNVTYVTSLKPCMPEPQMGLPVSLNSVGPPSTPTLTLNFVCVCVCVQVQHQSVGGVAQRK